MELTKEQIAFTRGFIRKVAADDGGIRGFLRQLDETVKAYPEFERLTQYPDISPDVVGRVTDPYLNPMRGDLKSEVPDEIARKVTDPYLNPAKGELGDLSGFGADPSLIDAAKDWFEENKDSLANVGIGGAAGAVSGNVLLRLIMSLMGKGKPGRLGSAAATLAGGGAGAAAGHYKDDIAGFLGDLFGSGGSTA